jgi:hypothetical protein
MSDGINATFISSKKFNLTGNLTDLFIAGKKVKAYCGNDGYKFGKISSTSFVPSAGNTRVMLDNDSDDLTSGLLEVWYESSPHMEDGRPIVRSDTRPLNTSTYFTMEGDSPNEVGGGEALVWDFTNNDNNYTGSEVPSGYKAKEIKISFSCPVHIKDGTIYFFNAPWGQYVQMDIIVPTGSYYPNPTGSIPASALGLSGNKMYSQATEDTIFQRYVSRHFIFKDCPMGDELNAEGAAVDALPIGWYIRGLIVTPESDVTSKGYASLEMYRCHTAKLPGMTSLH